MANDKMKNPNGSESLKKTNEIFERTYIQVINTWQCTNYSLALYTDISNVSKDWT